MWSRMRTSRQLSKFCLCLPENRDVRVGVFPQGEEILVPSLRLGQISGQRERSAQLQVRQCAYGIRTDDTTMIEKLLKFRNSFRIPVCGNKCLAAHVRRVQTAKIKVTEVEAVHSQFIWQSDVQ